MGEVGYKTLAIDIETFSDVDLIKCGVYAYADSPAFEILLFAYSFDDEETKIIDLAQGEQLTEEIKNALSDVGIIKTAFNANFERTCLSKYMGVRLSPESWVCTAVQSAMLALPLSLEGVGAVLGLSEQKLKELDFFEHAVRGLSGKLPEIVWDMAVERFTWEELMMKYHISHTMVAKYRKKAIKELDALYEERDRQTESFILR